MQQERETDDETNVLPDFPIGAIAEVTGATFDDQNAKDFLGYFLI